MKIQNFLLAALFVSQFSYGTVYYCTNSGSTELDMFKSGSPYDLTKGEGAYTWIVDTDKGWRRTDVSTYSGSCFVDKGYTVCKADTSYGEAIFSIHPDDSNFILIYIDYGIDLLAFVGNCKKT